MLAGGGSNVRRSMPKSDSPRGKAEFMSRSCSRSLSSGDHRWTESGRKMTTIPANPASVTATCAAMPRASLVCIATIKGEHGHGIKAQIHAPLNHQFFDRSPKHPRPIWVRAFAVFGDEMLDPPRDNGKRYRAELEHGCVRARRESRNEMIVKFMHH